MAFVQPFPRPPTTTPLPTDARPRVPQASLGFRDEDQRVKLLDKMRKMEGQFPFMPSCTGPHWEYKGD